MISCSVLNRACAAAALIAFSQAAYAQTSQSNSPDGEPAPTPAESQESTTAATAPDAATAAASPANAGQGSASGDIIVTAQRREQQLQKVPLTVTALSDAQLKISNIKQIVDLSAIVPNVSVRVQANGIQLYMRGVGANTGASPGDEPSIATYVDGMYNPFGASVAAYNLPSIQRVEVLKGPQGTLFGRNSTGGVIQIITKDPSMNYVTGTAEIGYGSYQTFEGKAYLSAPLASNVAIGLSLYENKQSDGFGHNIYLGDETFRHDDTDLRAKLLWTPGPSTEVRLIGEYHHYKSDAPQFQLSQGVVSFLDGSTYPGEYNTQGNFNELNKLNDYSVSAKLDQDVGSLHFSDQATYRWYRQETRQDLDTTPVQYLDAYLYGRATVFTNEAQLFGPKHSNLDWVIGAYYFRMDGGYDPFHEVGIATGALPYLDVYSNQIIDSFAIYGQATYTIADRTHLTVGLRNTWEKHQLDGSNVGPGGVVVRGPISQSEDSSKPTWRLALAQDFTPSVSGYISYNRGIKSGGYSMTSPFSQGYEPEQLDAFEAGIKTRLFDNVLTFNPAVFHYNYKNIQVRQLLQSSNIVTNAAAAESEGFDFDYSVKPGGGFSLSGGFGYLWKAKFTDYQNALAYHMNGGSYFIDATGNRLVNAPKVTLSSQASYEASVGPDTKLLFSFGGAYESSSFAQADNRFQYNAHVLLNGSIAFDWRNYEARVWMTNITNAEYYSYRSEGTFGDFQVRGEPREAGISLSVNF